MNEDDQKSPAEEPDKASEVKPTAPQKSAVETNQPRWPFWLILLAALLAGGLGVIAALHAQAARDLALNNQQSLNNALAQIAAFDAQVGEIPERLTQAETALNKQLEDALEGLQTELAAAAEQHQRRVQNLEDSLTALHAELSQPQRDWQLAEALYLVNVAAHRLEFHEDAPAAQAALQAADGVLMGIGDPRMIPAREALAEDIQALENYQGVAITDLLTALDDLMTDVRPLPLKMPEVSADDPEVAVGGSPPDPDAAWWSRQLQQLWQEVSQQFTIRRHAQAVRSMPDAEAEMFIRQVIALRLESARMAVLRRDQSDFEAHLTRAASLLEDYFAASPVSDILPRIDALRAQSLHSELPSLKQSLSQLQALED